jgi:hypothetical protein
MISAYISWYVKPNSRAIPAFIAPRFIHINSRSVPNVLQCTVQSFNAPSKGVSSTQLELLFRELNTELYERQYKYIKSISECSATLRSFIFMYQVTIDVISFTTSHSLCRKIKMTFCDCELDSKTLPLRETTKLWLFREMIFIGVFPITLISTDQ